MKMILTIHKRDEGIITTIDASVLSISEIRNKINNCLKRVKELEQKYDYEYWDIGVKEFNKDNFYDFNDVLVYLLEYKEQLPIVDFIDEII